jgi:hypothetical protein
MRNLLTATLLLTSTIPALADGKQDTIVAVNVVIAKTDCGLNPMGWSSDTAERSRQFTGLGREEWANAIGDMATIKAEQMYADRSMGKFCAGMAIIYARAAQ